MREKKSKASYNDLYAYVPHPYHEYLRHIEDLGFSDRPDYEALRAVLRARLRFEEKFCKPRGSSGSEAHVDSETTLHEQLALPSTMMRGLETTSFGSKARFQSSKGQFSVSGAGARKRFTTNDLLTPGVKLAIHHGNSEGIEEDDLNENLSEGLGRKIAKYSFGAL